MFEVIQHLTMNGVKIYISCVSSFNVFWSFLVVQEWVSMTLQVTVLTLWIHGINAKIYSVWLFIIKLHLNINSIMQLLYLEEEVHLPLQCGRKRFKQKHGTLIFLRISPQLLDSYTGSIHLEMQWNILSCSKFLWSVSFQWLSFVKLE